MFIGSVKYGAFRLFRTAQAPSFSFRHAEAVGCIVFGFGILAFNSNGSMPALPDLLACLGPTFVDSPLGVLLVSARQVVLRSLVRFFLSRDIACVMCLLLGSIFGSYVVSRPSFGLSYSARWEIRVSFEFLFFGLPFPASAG